MFDGIKWIYFTEHKEIGELKRKSYWPLFLLLAIIPAVNTENNIPLFQLLLKIMKSWYGAEQLP
jgi:hypothetical protein